MLINNVFLCRLKMGLRGNSHARISWAYWFKKILYYQVALVYMLTRLVVNVSQVTKGNSLFFGGGGGGILAAENNELLLYDISVTYIKLVFLGPGISCILCH